MSAYTTFAGLWSQVVGAVGANMNTSSSTFAGVTSQEETLGPGSLNGTSFFPSIEQVLCLIIADGLLVSLHCI